MKNKSIEDIRLFYCFSNELLTIKQYLYDAAGFQGLKTSTPIAPQGSDMRWVKELYECRL